MRNALLALALAGAGLGFAPSADAVRPCDAWDVQCHQTCTLPQTDQGIKNIYWYSC